MNAFVETYVETAVKSLREGDRVQWAGYSLIVRKIEVVGPNTRRVTFAAMKHATIVEDYWQPIYEESLMVRRLA